MVPVLCRLALGSLTIIHVKMLFGSSDYLPSLLNLPLEIAAAEALASPSFPIVSGKIHRLFSKFLALAFIA